MSGNNNELNGTMVAIFIVCAILSAVIQFIAALAVFAAIIATIVAVIAWINGGLQMGDDYLSKESAISFILRGVMCGILAPVFLKFACAFLDWDSSAFDWEMIGLCGYAYGSVGIAIIEAMEGKDQQPPTPPQAVLPPLPEPEQRIPHVVERDLRPFEHADWDDEELFK